jgi:flagellar basal-body rod modification protein FlgD
MSSVASVGSSNSLDMIQSSTLGKDEFFQMLIAQLKYQDPLNPMDGTDFTAQLAQFSSLEQLSNMNSNLETVAAYQMKTNQAEAVALIGKNVAAQGNSVETDGTPVSLIFNAAVDITEGAVSIYNSDGSLVKTIDLGARPQGTNSVIWDCSAVANGSYTFEIEAADAAGESVDVDMYVNGTVTGVSFLDGRSYIQIGDVEIPFEDVIAVSPGT